ncbi:MAG: metallophosphoesterase, partial [Chloroflexia bacterium]
MANTLWRALSLAALFAGALWVLLIAGGCNSPSTASVSTMQVSPLPRSARPDSVHFATIGDFGNQGQPEAEVAALVSSWNPDFIITLGDNNYPDGAQSTIDPNIGQYYSTSIYPYTGAYTMPTAPVNRFFPSLGNHDWIAADAAPYLGFFTLPNNERYYDVVQGPVHLFSIDSDSQEPDGNTSNSIQGEWLRTHLASAPEPWKLVYFHHPPYSSGSSHGSSPWMQWPFQQWGASAVLSGHEHNYERLLINGFPYFVNGLGGTPNIYGFGEPLPGSQMRYNAEHGAMLVDADPYTITFRFYTSTGLLIDTYTMQSGLPTPTITPTATATHTQLPTFTSTSTSTPTPISTSTPTLIPTSTPSSTPFAATATPTAQPTSTTIAATSTSTATLTHIPTLTAIPTSTSSATSTGTPQPTSTAVVPSSTATTIPTSTAQPPTATPTICSLQFTDVPPAATFYSFVHCLTCLGIISGYPCGGPGE